MAPLRRSASTQCRAVTAYSGSVFRSLIAASSQNLLSRTGRKVGSIQQMLNTTLLPKRDALVKVELSSVACIRRMLHVMCMSDASCSV